MGYSPHYFTSYVHDWIAQGWLPKSGKLMDFGSQEFDGDADDQQDVRLVPTRRRFARRQKVQGAVDDAHVSVFLTAP